MPDLKAGEHSGHSGGLRDASQKSMPLGQFIMQDLLAWYRETPYPDPENWVFAFNSRWTGKKRGKQPLWLSAIMRYHIQPVVKRLGINKRVSCHTFRRTYAALLHANGEDMKVCRNYCGMVRRRSWTSMRRRRCPRSGRRSRRWSRWRALTRRRESSKWAHKLGTQVVAGNFGDLR
jgi:integrase